MEHGALCQLLLPDLEVHQTHFALKASDPELFLKAIWRSYIMSRDGCVSTTCFGFKPKVLVQDVGDLCVSTVSTLWPTSWQPHSTAVRHPSNHSLQNSKLSW